MTNYTTNLALPKPQITDRVADGWDAIADLADALDAYLAGRAAKRWLKAADTTRSAGAAYSADAHLAAMALPTVAGVATEWEVRAYTAWTATNNTMDVRQYFSVTGAGVIMGDRWCSGPSTAATDESAASPLVQSVRPYNDPVGYGIGAITYPTGIREAFRIYVPAGIAATFSQLWAPIAASGGTVTLKTGSFVTAHRIA